MASNKDKTKRILCSEWLLSCTTQWKETGGREHGRTGGVRGREAGAEIKKAIVAIEHPTILKRKFWKQENLNLYSGWKNSITTSGEFGNPFHSTTSQVMR